MSEPHHVGRTVFAVTTKHLGSFHVIWWTKGRPRPPFVSAIDFAGMHARILTIGRASLEWWRNYP